jgi:DNA-binding transcriptional regulator GbsR (MarR family)
LQPVDQQFIDFYRAIGKSYNFDDLTSLIFARLFIDPEEVAMEDLAKETGYSLASISNKLKILEAGNFITRRTRPGTRKVYVYAPKDMPRLIASILAQYQQGEIAKVKSDIPPLLEGMKGKKLGKRERAQIAILKKYYDDSLFVDGIVTKFIGELEREDRQ